MDAPLTAPMHRIQALPVAGARMKINDFDESKTVESGDKFVTFNVSLKAGKTSLQTWLYNSRGNELCGAYYVRVYRK